MSEAADIACELMRRGTLPVTITCGDYTVTTENAEVVRAILAMREWRNTAKRSVVDRIVWAVCDVWMVSPVDIYGKSRESKIVEARAVARYLVRELTSMSYPEIARCMHAPNHSTIITCHQRVEQKAGHDPVLARRIAACHYRITVRGGTQWTA